MVDILEDIKKIIGSNAILEGSDISNRASSYWDATPISAKAIVKPKHTDELSLILKQMNDQKQILVTHGGLTGCAQAANTTPDHIALSMERMNKIIEIDDVGGTVTLEAGII